MSHHIIGHGPPFFWDTKGIGIHLAVSVFVVQSVDRVGAGRQIDERCRDSPVYNLAGINDEKFIGLDSLLQKTLRRVPELNEDLSLVIADACQRDRKVRLRRVV